MSNRVLKTLAIVGALLVPVAVATLFTARGVDAQGASTVGNPTLLAEIEQLRAQLTAVAGNVDGLKPKRFYLTQEETFDGAGALNACAAGFHMASIFEVNDPSNLRYDTELGFSWGDSGSGPPAPRGGWIRTGANTNNNVDFPSNCNAWTTTEGRGAYAELVFELEVASPWHATNESCSQTERVWCVQD